MRNEQSFENLLESAYQELRDLARHKLASERNDHTLQPTALVHEVYCRLRQKNASIEWHGRDHFMAAAAEAMRRILVEHARRKLAAKRGGTLDRLALDDFPVLLPLAPADVLAIHDALDRLAEESEVAAELVKLRYFAGFSQIDAATHLGLSKGKADRIWSYAKARLYLLIAGNARPHNRLQRKTDKNFRAD